MPVYDVELYLVDEFPTDALGVLVRSGPVGWQEITDLNRQGTKIGALEDVALLDLLSDG